MLDEAQVLAGRILTQHPGLLRQAHNSVTNELRTPASGLLLLGEDGLLFVSTELAPTKPADLATWDSTHPFVAGDFYFVPWTQLVEPSALTHADFGGSAVSFKHCDGGESIFQSPNWSTVQEITARALDLCRGDSEILYDPDLRMDIAEVLLEMPLIEADEVVAVLIEMGWENLEEAIVEAILCDADFPAYHFRHLWFTDEGANPKDHQDEPLTASIIAALIEEPDSAEGLFMRLDELGEAPECVGDIYDVLYTAEIPVFKRTKAWYFKYPEEGEES